MLNFHSDVSYMYNQHFPLESCEKSPQAYSGGIQTKTFAILEQAYH